MTKYTTADIGAMRAFIAQEEARQAAAREEAERQKTANAALRKELEAKLAALDRPITVVTVKKKETQERPVPKARETVEVRATTEESEGGVSTTKRKVDVAKLEREDCNRCASRGTLCLMPVPRHGKQAPSSCIACRSAKAKCSYGDENKEDMEPPGTHSQVEGRPAKRMRRAAVRSARIVQSESEEEDIDPDPVVNLDAMTRAVRDIARQTQKIAMSLEILVERGARGSV